MSQNNNNKKQQIIIIIYINTQEKIKYISFKYRA